MGTWETGVVNINPLQWEGRGKAECGGGGGGLWRHLWARLRGGVCVTPLANTFVGVWFFELDVFYDFMPLCVRACYLRASP